MDNNKLQKAIQLAKQNPNSDFANELRKRIESGQIQVEKKEPNYFQRVGEQYQQLGERVKSAVEQGATPTESVGGDVKQLGRTVLRGVGAVAEGAFAPITEAPVIKQTLDLIGEKLADTKLGQTLAQKVQENPESAQDIFDALNVLSLGVGKTIEAPAKAIAGEGLSKAGVAIEKGGLKAVDAEKNKFIRELIRPEQTKTVKEAQVGRTIEKGSGVLKRSEILPTEQELRIEKAVSTIPEVKKTNTFQQNYNVIKEANTKEAQLLEKQIAEKDFAIPKKEVKARLKQAQASLSESPLITGDAEKMAEKLLAKANQLVDSNSGTGSGLLKARKEFDAWVLSQKPKAFDATAENAFTLANREVRKTFNTLLDEKAVDVGVKESLSKQSALYNAMDNIAPKAAQEADTAIGRAYNNLSKLVGTKNKSVQIIAALAGIGGLGAAATFATPALIGGGLAFLGYKGTKLLMKPQIRVQLGKLLQQSGHLLNPEDKKILEEAINTYSETPNKQGGFVSLKGKGTIPENSNYLYHGTNESAFERIQNEGIKPQRRGVSSLSKTEEYSRNWSDNPYTNTKGVMLRVKSDYLKGKTIRNNTKVATDKLNEVLTKETIPPEAIEVYKNGKWQPLKSSSENSLISEAKKYNSAEEFIKSSDLKVEYATNKLKVAEDAKPITVTVYHGSPDARFAEEFVPNKKGYFKDAPDLLPDNTQWNELYGSTGGGFKTGTGVYEGISFSDDFRVAKSYADKPAFDSQNSVPMVLERTVTLNKPKVIDVANGEWKISLEKTIEQAKKEGYDGIIFKNIKDNYHPSATQKASNNIIAFSQDQIKTKSQLEDIWNKANKK